MQLEGESVDLLTISGYGPPLCGSQGTGTGASHHITATPERRVGWIHACWCSSGFFTLSNPGSCLGKGAIYGGWDFPLQLMRYFQMILDCAKLAKPTIIGISSCFLLVHFCLDFYIALEY